MDEFYLLDSQLNEKHIIDTFSSAIWVPRYNDIGDCELVIDATVENFKKIEECKYISRNDDDMACEIKKVEIKTDIESSNQLIITGIDIKTILDQRIVVKQTNFSGLAEDYIRTLINDAIINPADLNRKINNFILAERNGYTEKISEQVTYDNIGKKIRELCKHFGWGYKVLIQNKKFVFSLYKGEDRSGYITFSPSYDNIATTDYIKDATNEKNVALVAGEGEGVARATTTIGAGIGIDRRELYIDARDISSSIDYQELLSSYPNGNEKVINDAIYYQINDTNIAILTKNENGEVSKVKLCNEIYTENLKSVGCEKIAEYSTITSFSGEIIPNINYKYKRDYNLGDIVNILNEYGISIDVRITEILESQDENGYKNEPVFENI